MVDVLLTTYTFLAGPAEDVTVESHKASLCLASAWQYRTPHKSTQLYTRMDKCALGHARATADMSTRGIACPSGGFLYCPLVR